ncbi:tyrosine-type recombinase/integrase [Couchioplanes caeruleus]|uniref:LacI family transcriptional regulator n=2 Tax=Couchioplanes caeruleus TaxID=56438 RepID=A0A1K0G7T6_9ACTN|nr:LacI family DNA-binding transcriptional regulator [Couchioplanes caeruleus]OJF13306.1 LacI family transcriptional regulator [Couchioplanes caeruleus subsp. caeruleus]ROP33498.1 phage integrase family protein [Couchioplanes caeruleus]
MGYAEKRGDYWRGRYKLAPGRYATVVDTNGATMKFRTRRDAEQAANDAEAKVRNGGRPPRAAGRMTFAEYVNDWYARQELARSTMQNYQRTIEDHLLPAFQDFAVAAISPADVMAWEKRERALGYAEASLRLWRTTLHLILADAVDEGLRESNPAARRRGRGKRAGRSQKRAPEKTVTTGLGILLLAERAALLSGRDDEFLAVTTLGFTGLRWGELVGLETRYIRPGEVRVEWQLYELDTGELHRCPPKDDSYRTVHVPEWLGSLLTTHVAQTALVPCACHGHRYAFRGYGTANGAARRPGPKLADVAQVAGVSTGTVSNVLNRPRVVQEATRDKVTAAIEQLGFVCGAPTGTAAGHYRRNGFATWLFQPAATGRYPAKAPKVARPVPVAADPWPGVPIRGRSAASRAEACWLPIAPGLTPHGLRHTYKTLMVELGTPSTVMDAQMGHADGSVQARYAHATVDMIRRLLDGLTELWENALAVRRQLASGSPVAVLDHLLREKIVSQNSPQQAPGTEKAGPRIRDTGPDLLFYGRADRI